MGFNYGREKRRFDKEWEQLQKEYAAAGMEEVDIARLWGCMRSTVTKRLNKIKKVLTDRKQN